MIANVRTGVKGRAKTFLSALKWEYSGLYQKMGYCPEVGDYPAVGPKGPYVRRNKS
jgi:hypothetical protein